MNSKQLLLLLIIYLVLWLGSELFFCSLSSM